MKPQPTTQSKTGRDRLVVRLLAMLACGVLLAGCGATEPGSSAGGQEAPEQPEQSASAQAQTGSQPARLAAGWLESQLTDGLVYNKQYDFEDVGLSIDVALGLEEVQEGSAAPVVEAVSDPKVLSGYTGSPQGPEYAGSVAKAAVLALSVGEDPTAFGGTDLVARLEALVGSKGAAQGRISDRGPEDYANVLGQAYAVWALSGAGSDRAEEATGFLLAQQCEAGFFRATFSPESAADQSCDGDPKAAPAVDTTALAVVALQQQQSPTAEVEQASSQAVDWLLSAQADDGSFTSGVSEGGTAEGGEPVPNANSTGLAGWALADAGETEAAAQAAAWLAELQVTPDAEGKLAQAAGAVPYDAQAAEAAAGSGITTKTADQWRRATAQAILALPQAPADPAVPDDAGS